jgi:hypothetical protein
MAFMYYVEMIYRKIKHFFFPPKKDKDKFIY